MANNYKRGGEKLKAKIFKVLILVFAFSMCSILVYAQSTNKTEKLTLDGIYTVKQIEPQNKSQDIKYFLQGGGGEVTVQDNVCTLKTPTTEFSWSLDGMKYWVEDNTFYQINEDTNETWTLVKIK